MSYATSLSEEECAVLDTLDPVDTMEMEDGDENEPDYTPVEHPSKSSLSPGYTSAGLELLNSKYKPDEDE